MNAYRFSLILIVLMCLSILTILFACATGSVWLSGADLLNAIKDSLNGTSITMTSTLFQLRLERALGAFVTGATLGQAGVMMQALIRNPLADPYILGVSGGAAVGALAAMLWGAAAWMIEGGAFGGAIASAAIVYVLVRRDWNGGTVGDPHSSLLLTGVMLASGCGALVTLMLSIAPDNHLRGMVFWLMGDLSGVPIRVMPWMVLVGMLIFFGWSARALNVLMLHGDVAVTLGVPVVLLRKSLFVCAALLTASAVTGAGSIGFVGLIVPHACRLAFGADHRVLLPVATFMGGIFLVLADTLARTILAPQQLPVGVVTAMIGVPVFLFQLHRVRR